MEEYKEIHIWEFSPKLTFIRLESKFRKILLSKIIKDIGSEPRTVSLVNKLSSKYGKRKEYSRGTVYNWLKGKRLIKGKSKKVNIPLWALIEVSKVLSKSKKKDNKVMKKIEKNIVSYTSWGKSNPIRNPKLPLYLTPEMVSIIFNFVGDGHIGRKEVCCSYRQMNEEGLNNFLSRLKNIFGNFEYSKGEFNNGRLNIPRVIGDFYQYYFELEKTNTFDARIPKKVKRLKREFLVAGLFSFIVDEGHVGEVITIYSKNKKLIEDVKEIGDKVGYLCHPIRKKYARERFDVFRFNISIKSYKQIHLDIQNLSKGFPNCNLAHKNYKLLEKIR